MTNSSKPSPSSSDLPDTSVVVLSMGEPETERAIASIRRQSVRPAEVILVEGVRPLAAALREGASRVGTEFFIQVDSDMILDDICIESLRAAVSDGIGMVAGQLRDPLVGRTVGIKLYRKACFDDVGYPETPSTDTDFGIRLRRRGWSNLRLIRYEGASRDEWHTFGEHRPNYTPEYTFLKSVRDGRRYPYRGRAAGLRWILRTLGASTHPMATIARIAVAHGALDVGDRDSTEAEFSALRDFLASDAETGGARSLAPRAAMYSLRPGLIYASCLRHGLRCRRAGAPRTFERSWRRLVETTHPYAWLAAVGLAHGLFVDDASRERVARDMARLEPLVRDSRPVPVVRARARRILVQIRAAARRRLSRR